MKQVTAIYEAGVLRPLEPLDLEEHQHVTLTINEHSDTRNDLDDAAFRAWCAQEAGENIPDIDTIRRELASIPGSLVDMIRAERDAR